MKLSDILRTKADWFAIPKTCDEAHDYAIAHDEDIVDLVREIASLLGFDLVPRLTPQQAHEAMLALRLKEDIPAFTRAAYEPDDDGEAKGFR